MDQYDDLDFAQTARPDNDKLVFGGRYEVVRKIGSGAMGMVYLAKDNTLDGREVAIKVPSDSWASDSRAIEDLKREALSAMTLNHPGAVAVRSFEESVRGVFLVMDYVPGGRTLADRLHDGPLSVDEAQQILQPVAEALDYAHKQGLIHRDVKPGNVMLTPQGGGQIADFGIARLSHEAATRVTQPGQGSSGTLLYMSPEHIAGEAPSASQDVYAFAAMLYEALSGKPPFYQGDVSYQIVNQPPKTLELDSVHADLAKAIMQGLSKQPQDRPACCVALLQAKDSSKSVAKKPSAILVAGVVAGGLLLCLLAIGGAVVGGKILNNKKTPLPVVPSPATVAGADPVEAIAVPVDPAPDSVETPVVVEDSVEVIALQRTWQQLDRLTRQKWETTPFAMRGISPAIKGLADSVEMLESRVAREDQQSTNRLNADSRLRQIELQIQTTPLQARSAMAQLQNEWQASQQSLARYESAQWVALYEQTTTQCAALDVAPVKEWKKRSLAEDDRVLTGEVQAALQTFAQKVDRLYANAQNEAESACRNGDLQALQMLLYAGASVHNLKTAQGEPMLHLATKANHESIVSLLATPASVQLTDKGNRTALHWAKSAATVKALVEQGAKINVFDMSRNTPLHLAAERGDINTVKALLEAGASTAVKNEFRQLPVDMARRYEVRKLLKP